MQNWLKTGSLKRARTVTESDKPRDSDQDNNTDEPKATCSEIELAQETNEDSSDEYMNFGFTINKENDTDKFQCVLCKQELAKSSQSMELARQHLEEEHRIYKDKPVEFFKEKLFELKHNLTPPTSSSRIKISKAKYVELYNKARDFERYSISPDLIVPCAKVMFESMLGEEVPNKIDMNFLRNDKMPEGILEMSKNVEATLVDRLRRCSAFALQLHETSDLPELAVLLVIVRCVYEGILQEEEMLICRAIPPTVTGVDIFIILNSYFKENKIDWATCCGISTDGAKSSSSIYQGFACCTQTVAPHVPLTYCTMRRQDFTMKGMPHDLKIVLDDVVKIVNVMKDKPDRTGILSSLYERTNSAYNPLLKYTENWWLSCEGILKCFYNNRNGINFYNPVGLLSVLRDPIWLQKLAYLVDIFELVNETPFTFSVYTNVFTVQNKMESLMKRVSNLVMYLNKNQTEYFPTTLDYFLLEKQLKLDKNVKVNLIEHLTILLDTFKTNFPSIPDSNNWIRNPFQKMFVNQAKHLSRTDKKVLRELSGNSALKTLFGRKLLINFWLEIMDAYPRLAEKAIKFLLPFSSTALCEKAFSAYIVIKNNYQINLSVEPELRLYLTLIDPDFEALCA